MQMSKLLLLCFAGAALCTAPMARSADAENDNIAKAREALWQKMSELEGDQSAGLTDTVPTDTEEMAKARRALRDKLIETQAAYGFAPVTVPVQLPPRDSEDSYKVREALRQKMDAPAAAPSAPPAAVVRRAPPGANAFTPMPRVQSPLANEKQQKLQELLRRYQADELTPSQYHEQRAKILAGP
jgi:hypothetical protein